ncbi:transmembrane protein 104-like isoform X1 [Leptotrombidium deliense]|uniref:Transmembrane protein 104-like isoform X1 n=1 Tax=Leptotrombidium deliense TaxID=299467 RepID=A0A443STF9_9ACAR|nr:transmembrane protein 104-like isoform X1 [Leptotrombidium deliense]
MSGDQNCANFLVQYQCGHRSSGTSVLFHRDRMDSEHSDYFDNMPNQFVNYATFTFVIESMAIANGIIKMDAKDNLDEIENEEETNEDLCSATAEIENKFLADEDDETLTVLSSVSSVSDRQTDYGTVDIYDESDVYEITEHAELGRIAKMVMKREGVIFFYICMCVYLYGDLSVYCTAISRTLRDFTWYVPPFPNLTLHFTFSYSTIQPILHNETLTEMDPCWQSFRVSRMFAYRLYVFGTILVLGPFVFFDLHNTKFLQIFTLSFRLLAFTAFVTLTTIALAKGNGDGRPVEANFSNIPNFFGVAIFAFISHQALPSIITPIKQKKHLLSISLVNFLFIAIFYLLICFTGAFTFNHVNDVYALNFVSHKHYSLIPEVPVLTFILPLYPLFTISANFPINAITLRNNLKLLFTSSSESFHSTFWFQRIAFPILTLLPVFCIAITTSNLVWLVSLVGNYTGILIQCVIPSLILIYARRRVKEICESNHLFAQFLNTENKYKSPFGYNVVIYSILIWSIICLCLITANLIL